MDKPWYKSKTLWFNVLVLVGVLLDDVLKSNLIQNTEVVAAITTVVNILLRLKTFTSLTK